MSESRSRITGRKAIPAAQWTAWIIVFALIASFIVPGTQANRNDKDVSGITIIPEISYEAGATLKTTDSIEHIVLRELTKKTVSAKSVSYDEELGASIVADAKKYLGLPYKAGGFSPKGFDCSGFTCYIYKKNGIKISRTAREQSGTGTYIPISEVKPGDIVCWDKPGTSHHVGIYIGGKKFIHSVQTGDVIRIQSFKERKPVFAVRF
jgi:cell wall-associated NlpC family hydrolase